METFNDFYCPICKKQIELKKKYSYSEIPGMLEIEYNLFHPPCRRLYNKREKLRNELKCVDLQIFRKFLGIT